MRLYAKADFLAIFSETPMPISVLRPFVSELIDWIASKSPRPLFSFGGIPEPRRLEKEKPKVFVVGNRPEVLNKMTSIDLLQFAGKILGFEVDASLLLESADEAKIQMRALMRRTQQLMVPMRKRKDRSSCLRYICRRGWRMSERFDRSSEPALTSDWARSTVTCIVSP